MSEPFQPSTTKSPNSLPNNIAYYKYVSFVLFAAFFLIGIILLCLQTKVVQASLAQVLDAKSLLLVELYFWAAMGASVASYKHFAEDKEINEIESLKEKPDPKVLRYPNLLDVVLYVQRILFSGILGVIGGMIVMAGLGYFEVELTKISDKQRMFFIVLSFIVGIHQNDFLAFLRELNKKLLPKKSNRRRPLKKESAKSSSEEGGDQTQ